jgi:hypothetical protein
MSIERSIQKQLILKRLQKTASNPFASIGRGIKKVLPWGMSHPSAARGESENLAKLQAGNKQLASDMTAAGRPQGQVDLDIARLTPKATPGKGASWDQRNPVAALDEKQNQIAMNEGQQKLLDMYVQTYGADPKEATALMQSYLAGKGQAPGEIYAARRNTPAPTAVAKL